jgi:hypothetical protein
MAARVRLSAGDCLPRDVGQALLDGKVFALLTVPNAFGG